MATQWAEGLEQRVGDLEYMQDVLIQEGSDLERRALTVPIWWAGEEDREVDEEAYEDEEDEEAPAG